MFKPTFCKVLVRYNPEGDKTLNQRQAARLKRLSDYLHGKGQASSCSSCLSRPKKAQLRRSTEIRRLTTRRFVRASWCSRSSNSRTPALSRTCGKSKAWTGARIASTWSRRPGETAEARSAASSSVAERTTKGARVAHRRGAVPGFIGFAVGRTTFWDPLVDSRARKRPVRRRVAEIARRYREWVGIFESARGA